MAKPHGPAPCLPSGDVFANTFSSIPRGVSIVIEFLSRAGDASAGPKDSAAASSASTGGAFGGSAGTTGTTRRPETLCSLGGNGEAAASSASAALPVSARAGFHKEVEVASAPQNARYIAVVQDVEELPEICRMAHLLANLWCFTPVGMRVRHAGWRSKASVAWRKFWAL